MWFKDFQQEPQGVADLVNYGSFVADGVLVQKDGTLLTAWKYRGPDLDSATPEELDALISQVNRALLLLGSDSAVHVDAVRRPILEYPGRGRFLDPVSRSIELERAAEFASGASFETVFYLALTWSPPKQVETRLGKLFVSGYDGAAATDWGRLLEIFETKAAEFGEQLRPVLATRRLDSDGLLEYLHGALNGIWQPIALGRYSEYIDFRVADQDFVAGFLPRIGQDHLRVIGVEGLPFESQPAMLDALGRLPIRCRWSTRFLPLDAQEAAGELEKRRKYWKGQIFGFAAILQSKESYERSESQAAQNATFSRHAANLDAVKLVESVDSAVADNASGAQRYGFLTNVVVVHDTEARRADEAATLVIKELRSKGFGARLETVNAVEAFLGSLPGHTYQNVRQPPIGSSTLADLLPLTALWAGNTRNPSPLMPKGSSCLAVTYSTGETPFFLNLHTGGAAEAGGAGGDVGHSLILGPTGTGKSSLLCFLELSWLRYPSARVLCFDKGYSAYVPTLACGGTHYDVFSGVDRLAFAPLQGIADPNERAWAGEWLEQLFAIQGGSDAAVTPERRRAISRALDLMASSPTPTLTEFASKVQDFDLREAIRPYLAGEAFGALFDADHDQLADARFLTFEMSHLMEAGPRATLPALLYLFHRLEAKLDGRPTLIVVDECWTFLLHDLFATWLRRALKEYRKKNAAVVMATQSLADVFHSPHKAALLESCPTKILLPNPQALSPQGAEHYTALGLNDRQREILATATPKKHYYLLSPEGSRLLDLKLGPLALAFTTASSPERVQLARDLFRRYGEAWIEPWVEAMGLCLDAPAEVAPLAFAAGGSPRG